MSAEIKPTVGRHVLYWPQANDGIPVAPGQPLTGVIAAVINETVREAVLQGAAYLFTFLTSPFVLEASTAFIGLCVVMIINNRRMAKEGDGWVVMEVKKEPDTTVPAAEKQAE